MLKTNKNVVPNSPPAGLSTKW